MALKVNSGKKQVPRRMVIHGPNHVGKSSLAAAFPDVFIVDIEDGLGDIVCDSSDNIRDIDVFFSTLMEFVNDDHGFRWLAIDTVDWLEKLIQKKVVEDKGAKSFGDPCFDYGRGRKLCLPYWDRFLVAMHVIQSQKNVGIVLLSHSEAVDIKKPDMDSYQRMEPALDKDARELLSDWATEILMLDFRAYIRQVEEGFDRTRAIAVAGQMERFIQCSPTAAIRAKNRINLPDQIPFDSPTETVELIGKYVRANGPKAEDPVGNIEGAVVDGTSKAK